LQKPHTACEYPAEAIGKPKLMGAMAAADVLAAVVAVARVVRSAKRRGNARCMAQSPPSD
jgi:hypothetical protein